MNLTDRQKLAAMSRAYRLIAAHRAEDSPGIAQVVREAEADDDLVVLVLALTVTAADMADKLHGENVQRELDGRALDAMYYEEIQLQRLYGDDDA